MKTWLPSIIVVDDDICVAQTIAAMANSFGVQATAVRSASHLFELWRALAADAVIIDLQMPGSDGLDVIRQLGEMGRAQVILSSGCDARILEAARHAAHNNGLTVVGILPKPVRRRTLKRVLESIHKSDGQRSAPKNCKSTSLIERGDLRRALSDGQIRPYFQPKLRLCNRSIHGFEALARWDHPDVGLIMPDVFLPHVEVHGLTRAMTEAVMGQAIAFLSRLPARELTMAVNVSMSVCSESSFPEFLDKILARNGILASQLILEVTEAGSVVSCQEQIDALIRLTMKGYCLSLDDFGTGASSLERLVRIPFSELKIDRYFAREITTSARAAKLVRNLVRIGSDMDMSVTIEGIEDAATMLAAEKIGCEFGQGYHIARPMPGSKALEWMSGRA